jgi:hypothetical protein
MTEFEFLDKEFHRLNEAREALARKGKDTPEGAMAECWMLAIKGTIRDYLAMRQQKEQDQ